MREPVLVASLAAGEQVAVQVAGEPVAAAQPVRVQVAEPAGLLADSAADSAAGSASLARGCSVREAASMSGPERTQR